MCKVLGHVDRELLKYILDSPRRVVTPRDQCPMLDGFRMKGEKRSLE